MSPYQGVIKFTILVKNSLSYSKFKFKNMTALGGVSDLGIQKICKNIHDSPGLIHPVDQNSIVAQSEMGLFKNTNHNPMIRKKGNSHCYRISTSY